MGETGKGVRRVGLNNQACAAAVVIVIVTVVTCTTCSDEDVLITCSYVCEHMLIQECHD